MIRETIWNPSAMPMEHEHDIASRKAKAKHVMHCFDYLRQAIKCAGDLSLEWADQSEPDPPHISGWNIPHRQCKSWIHQSVLISGVTSWHIEIGRYDSISERTRGKKEAKPSTLRRANDTASTWKAERMCLPESTDSWMLVYYPHNFDWTQRAPSEGCTHLSRWTFLPSGLGQVLFLTGSSCEPTRGRELNYRYVVHALVLRTCHKCPLFWSLEWNTRCKQAITY